MPKYLFQASYTQDGLRGLVKEGGTRRRAMVENIVDEIGGTLEAFYYAFGDSDLYAIVELPDDVSATAASLIVGASGAASVKTTVLVTPETVDEAVKRSVGYRPPGS